MFLLRVSTLAAGLIALAVCGSHAATFTVINTNNSGAGSFRQAILDANATPNSGSTPDTIAFNIPGAGVRTIAPLTSLPPVNESVIIDGYTQPGAIVNSNSTTQGGLNGTLLIQLSGNAMPLVPGSIGIQLSTNSCTVRGLVINRFESGIFCEATSGQQIVGNYIGTDPSGNVPPVHSTAGVAQTLGVVLAGTSSSRIGGSTIAARNLISGNTSVNVFIYNSSATGNLVQGNLIGTNAAGTQDLIGTSTETGVAFQSGPTNNRVGSIIVDGRNIISGNGARGVSFFYSTAPVLGNNFVEGNYIGLDVTGTKAIPNLVGISVMGNNNTIGGLPAARNVISGNLAEGIRTIGGTGAANGTVVQRNFIGTDATGVKAIPNGGSGIEINGGGNNNVIGDDGTNAGNVIAFNGGAGVHVTIGTPSGVGNMIARNSIYRNKGLAIDLGGSGVNVNDNGDSDPGSNNTQNFPVLTSATRSGSDLVVVGTLNSLANQGFRIEIYSDVAADPSGYGEGRYYLGAVNVLTDANGNAPFTVTVPFNPLGTVASAIAISTAQDTSEFSQSIPIAGAASQLLNISTRVRVLTGDDVLFAGFIITGTEEKRVMVRGIGPSLAAQGVPGPLANPTLELFDQGSNSLAINDNWKDSQQAEIQATGVPPTNDAEAAIIRSLVPGVYTAILRGVNNTTGVGLVEVFDVEQPALAKLVNVSSRGFVDTGDNVMIGGFIVGGGPGGARVVARAIGPSLVAQGVASALSDPVLEVYNGSGVLIASNDNWRDTQQAELESTGLQPTNNAEAACVGSVPPGNYTAIVSGKSNTTGVALVEIYNIP